MGFTISTPTLYKMHGALQVAAFLLFFPIGILVAIFRESIGPTWLKIHIALQSLATLSVFAAIILVKVASARSEEKDTKDPKKIIRTAHKIVGPTVVTLIIVQWVLALWIRPHMDWMVWYNMHRATAALILVVGWVQLYLGYRLTH